MKAIVPIILAVLFASCAQFSAMQDEKNYDKIGDMELYYGDFPEIASPDDIGKWIGKNIAYAREKEDYWQSPSETINRGAGDCEDMAILYINILYVKFGAKADLAMVFNARQVVEGGDYNHAVVSLPDGRLISAQGGVWCYREVKYIYAFDEIFKGEL